jgi:hypothetical protein
MIRPLQKNHSTDGIKLHIPTLFLQHYSELFNYNNLEIPSEKQIVYYFLFLNTLYYSTFKLQNKNYIHYSGKFLKQLLGKNYVSIIQNLIKLEIIQKTKFYQPNKQNYGYKFNENFISYLNGNSFTETEIHNKIISRRLHKIYLKNTEKKKEKKKEQKLIQQIPEMNCIANNLNEFFNYYHSEEAISYVNEHFNQKSKINSKHKALNYIDKIKNKDTDIKLSKYGRIYTIATNAKKELLRFYNSTNFSSPLIEIDMVSSQPTLLNYFFTKYKIKNETVTVDNQNYNWKVDCVRIYDIFQELFNKKYNKKFNRKHIKRNIISYLNQSLWENERNKLHSIFKTYYPSVILLLQEMKKTDHRNFAQELQHIESEIFISNILFPFQEKYFILSKHDALIIESKDYEILKETIKNAMKKFNISNYKFKIKILSTDKEISETEISNLQINRTTTLDYRFISEDYRMTVSA